MNDFAIDRLDVAAMNSTIPPSQGPEPRRGLTPVLPPSGRFIAQLFVVPGLIVFGAVGFLLFIAYMTSAQASYSADFFLRRLDSANPDLRWRAANELAQILTRPEEGSRKWKADPHFALDLAERLQTALQDLREKEIKLQKKIAGLPPAEQDAAWGALKQQRDHVLYLAAALGEFHVPVGAPLLCAMSLDGDSPDFKGNAHRRRQAVWALTRLGENTRTFKQLPSEQQSAILETLKTEAEATNARASWARVALAYVDPAIPEDAVGVALSQVAHADDPFLREQAAFAFNFWPGPLAEATLLELSHDDGHGTRLVITEAE